MSRLTTLGWRMEIRSSLGRDGIRIPEFGLAARASHSESASESVGSEVLGGAGPIGDSIGITDTQFITTAGTTPKAGRFTTGPISTGEQARAAELGPGISVGVAEFTIVPGPPPGLSAETPRLLEDMLNPAVRAASARAPSAATTMADRQGAFRPAEVPA